eukprot:Hpha_TRINITY_DN16900_c2_g5::TRINITY_DN16900_c2_g5_i1::g.55099::m.55099
MDSVHEKQFWSGIGSHDIPSPTAGNDACFFDSKVSPLEALERMRAMLVDLTCTYKVSIVDLLSQFVLATEGEFAEVVRRYPKVGIPYHSKRNKQRHSMPKSAGRLVGRTRTEEEDPLTLSAHSNSTTGSTSVPLMMWGPSAGSKGRISSDPTTGEKQSRSVVNKSWCSSMAAKEEFLEAMKAPTDKYEGKYDGKYEGKDEGKDEGLALLPINNKAEQVVTAEDLTDVFIEEFKVLGADSFSFAPSASGAASSLPTGTRSQRNDDAPEINMSTGDISFRCQPTNTSEAHTPKPPSSTRFAPSGRPVSISALLSPSKYDD